MKRLFFTQQKPFDYRPLRAGLGLISLLELNAPGMTGLCPKLYTTRTRPMKGEYYVVEGSRSKATPVEPRIEFSIGDTCRLDLREELVTRDGEMWVKTTILDRGLSSFAELDLGIKGSSFEELRDILLRLNPKATIDSVFYVNKLEPLS